MSSFKNLSLYERDQNGALLAQKVKLVVDDKDLLEHPELKGQTIKLIPLTRGAIKELFSKEDDNSKDSDGELVVKYCKDPAYTSEEVVYLKPAYIRAIVKTVLEESGVVVSKGTGKKELDKDSDFGKN